MDQARLIVQSTRPKQWLKNLLVFAGLIFSQNLFFTDLLLRTVAAFVLFCLLSGATYLFNDCLDRESDARDPLKNRRPVASGRLSVRAALSASVILYVTAVGLAFLLDVSFWLVTVLYLIVQILYSLWLKRVVIIDLFAVVFSHLLRVIGGAAVIGVQISSWLLVCTILLALFLVVCKRRHELIRLEAIEGARQPSGDYSVALLDQMVSMVTSATVIAYCLYTMSGPTVMQTGTTRLMYTIPFVLYGILRYIYLVYRKTEGSYPEEVLLKDRALLVDILIWAGLVILFLYF